VLTCWLGEEAAQTPRRRFAEAGIASFPTPAAAVEGFMQLVRHARAQEQLMRTPPALPANAEPNVDAARSVIFDALAEGRERLREHEAKAVLAAYGIPVAETALARDPDAVFALSAALLGRYQAVVVKIVSDDIPHKSDVGGVRLGLTSPAEARQAAANMLARIAAERPGARIEGFAVQPMIARPRAHELIIGMTEDATFGPLLLFGAGGTAVEVLDDTAAALPPLDLKLAGDMIGATRVARLLAGYRDRPAADLDAIALALVQVSTLVTAHPEIREIDVNPLLADENGIIALDVRIRVADSAQTPRRRMAIRPYPSAWETTVSLAGIGDVRLRPIRPEDERLYQAFLARVTTGDLRLRLMAPVRELSHQFVARLTQIDYAREMAFVALSSGDDELIGVVRLHADPDYQRAEFAVLVRSDLKGRGLGWQLMQHLIAYARAEGLAILFGNVLAENSTMLRMCRELGFSIARDPDDATLFYVELKL
jgi:acetyltransferase